MVWTMENASELGRCRQIKKVFRIALAPFFMCARGWSASWADDAIVYQVEGFRLVNSRGHRLLAADWKRPWEFGYLAATINYDFDSRMLRVTNFDIKQVSFPAGATILRLAWVFCTLILTRWATA